MGGGKRHLPRWLKPQSPPFLFNGAFVGQNTHHFKTTSQLEVCNLQRVTKNRETYTGFLWSLPHLSDHAAGTTAETALPVRRGKVCSQPPGWRSDTSPIGKSLDV